MSDSRFRLFASLEPGDRFWTNELANYGPDELVTRILSDYYKNSRKSAERAKERLQLQSKEKLLHEVGMSRGRFIEPDSAEWPHGLDDLLAPPIGLVVRGKMPRCLSVAIVGTRNPTTYGARIASEFASGFADRDIEVISGGAYGIDTHVHRGALAAEGRTIAVLASGIEAGYPAGNERLFEEIGESGALISEVMPFESARPERFLTRNRLIAALARCTIVVEAAFRSGSLRTARDAAELLRIVLAVPGPINSPTSDGCHRLIGERCAEIVTSVPDAMELISSYQCTLCTDDS